MKKKFSRILGVGLAIALLSSLLVMAVPASAATLLWYFESSVDNMRKGVDNIIADGINIVDLAASGDILYAATSINATPLYKSTDGGETWSDLSTTTDFPEGMAVDLVAVAPDDGNTVVIATTEEKAYYSSTGGSKWTELDRPGTTGVIHDIDVSVVADGYRHVAAGGTDGTNAELYTMKLAMAEPWRDRAQYTDATGNFTALQDKIMAVRFSPNYETDKIVVCVSSDDSETDAYLQCFRDEKDAETWNGGISFFESWQTATSENGIELDTGDDSENIVGGLASASIALVDTYLGTDEVERIAFIGLAGVTSGGGVCRVSDNYVKHFATWSAGLEGQIHSIAYHDSGKLVAGDYDENQVYRALSPMATNPRFERTTSLKQPGGASLTLVDWSGDNAVAGTSGDESAFAVSTDDGYAFNDKSLIDTDLTAMDDVAVNADGSKVYMTTHNGTAASVWAKGSSWMRVLTLTRSTAAEAALLVRIAPDDAEAVYISSKGTQDMWVSKDSGKGKWKHVPCYKLDEVIDFEVESADVVYAIDSTGCSKTVNTGASWSIEETLDGVSNAQTIALAPNGDIMVGGMGDISFSKDGGQTFTRILDTTDTAPVHIVADKDYADNGMVYIAAGDEVERGKLDRDTTWASREDDAQPAFTSYSPLVGYTARGIAQLEHLIYVLISDGTSSELWRALDLKGGATGALCYWSHLDTGYELEATPRALKTSPAYKAEGAKFWAVDTASPTAYLVSAYDPLGFAGPTLISPAAGDVVQVNPESGQAYNITFTWERYHHKYIVACEIQIATDADFNAKLFGQTLCDIDSDIISAVIGPNGTQITGGTCDFNGRASFNPGTKYYWRVRVKDTTYGPLISPWSEANSFEIKQVIAFDILDPARGGSDVSTMPTFTWREYEGAIGYEIMVSEDPTFTIIEWSHSTANPWYQTTADEALAYATTYHWRARGVTGPAPAKQAAPGGPWATSIFTTMAEPTEATPPVIVQKEPAPPPEVKVVEVPVPGPAQAIPDAILWAIIAVGAILVIALIVLIVRTRRVT
jgi:hypothetical protein